MTDDALPIVYRGRMGNALFVLAIGVVLLAVGFYAVREPMNYLVGVNPRVRVPAPVLGWMLVPVGLAILALALAGIMRGCPRLELNAEGVAFTTCWRGTRRMAWRDLARVDVRRNDRADIESVALIPAHGRTMFVGQAVAPANELRAAIERVAARMKGA